MSHLRTCTLEIKNVKETVLGEALKLIAKDLNDTITTVVKDYYGQGTRVTAGLKNLGYGINIIQGRIQVVGDSYNKSIELETFMKKVSQAYATVVTQKALVKQGYTTRVALDQKTRNYVLVGERA